MFNDLYIQLPKNFEEQYLKYKAALLGEETKPVETVIVKEAEKKYPVVKEDIEIKNLDVKIQGDYIFFKKGKSAKMNPTDRRLIDFLNYRSHEDKQYCSSPESLAREAGKAEGYIKNRIVHINKEFKKLINPSGNKTNIDELIKYESGRGYRLNPRFVIKITKAEKTN